MQTTTPSEKKYFKIMINDYSRYTEEFLLRSKSVAVQYIRNVEF